METACLGDPFKDVLKQSNASNDKQEIAATNELSDKLSSVKIAAILSVCPGDHKSLLVFVFSADASFPASNAMPVFLSALSSLAADTITVFKSVIVVADLPFCILTIAPTTDSTTINIETFRDDMVLGVTAIALVKAHAAPCVTDVAASANTSD